MTEKWMGKRDMDEKTQKGTVLPCENCLNFNLMQFILNGIKSKNINLGGCLRPDSDHYMHVIVKDHPACFYYEKKETT